MGTAVRMTEPHRPLAVVTGASSGIGLELAQVFAKHGFDLVVAADGNDIHWVAENLDAEAVQADLATPAGVKALHAQLRDRHVTALALNAGAKGHTDELDLVDDHCRSLVQLARLLTAEMVATGRGRVLITASSILETLPGPHQAAHSASKAFAEAFGVGLRRELREHGVTVTVLEPCPAEALQDTPDIAQEAFEALMAGRETVVAGSITTKASHPVTRILPDPIAARLTAIVKPR